MTCYPLSQPLSQTFRRQLTLALRDGILRQEQMADEPAGSRSVVHSLLLTVPFALIGKQLA